MPRTRVDRLAFNRGLVSRLGMARADIKRLAMAAEIQTNWVCRVLGSMMLRPGFGHLGSTLDDQKAFGIPFVFSIEDKADIELTDEGMRVWVNDAVVTRVAVSTAIAGGTFATAADAALWTDADEAGATSAWQAGGYLGLTGNGTAFAIRRQQVAVAAADRAKEHGVHIVIERGPVVLRVGTSAGDDSLINETELGTGVHSLAFTPNAANVWIEFKSRLERIVLVDSCEIEAAGDLVVETPWLEADLAKIRYDQSGDIIFIACDGYQQRKIERRATRSWSAVLYETADGPFRTENVSTTTLTASALTGNITIAASKPVFRSQHIGALFQLVSVGQRVEKNITAQNVFSDPIRITGVDSTRIFTIVVTGIAGDTVTLQRSLDEPGNWEDVTGESYVADTTKTFDDGLDNQIVYYRVGVKTGGYVAGNINASLAIGIGSITGVVRITGFTDSQNVAAEVLTALGSLAATEQWSEGEWSDLRGYPTAVCFHEGRLTWEGRDALQASISDAFDSFDPNFEGDAGPISRTIGSGPVDTIEWAISLQRLLLGGQAAEFSVRSSSLDEPLTPTNFNMKRASTKGSASVAAVVIDQSGIFVQRGGTRVYELSFGASGVDYEATHLSALIPEIGQPGIVKMVVQTQPDTRLHCLRSDGTVAMLVFDKLEQVIAWLEIETDGVIEDAVVLPGDAGDEEDFIYYYVKRTINGVTRRFKEKWAFEAECRGDAELCKLADSFVSYTGAPTTTVSAPHLAGEQVVIWADGADVGTDEDGNLTYTLDASGNATLPAAVTNYVVGLPYEAPWKSARLVELMNGQGGSLTDYAIVKGISLILADVHAKGLKYGQSLVESEMRDLPEFEASGPVDPDAVRTDYQTDPLAVPGEWSTDARLCLLAKAPRPATVLACLAEVEHHGG